MYIQPITARPETAKTHPLPDVYTRVILSDMDTTHNVARKKSGQQLIIAERNVLISKLIDLLCEGYASNNALAKKLRVSRDTISRYRPLADEIIAKTKLDRNVVRNLQVRRTYELIEQLMIDLKSSKSVKDRALIYRSIYQFSSHLALITGLNVETHVNVDPTKLVIIRSKRPSKGNKTIIEADEPLMRDSVGDMPVISDEGGIVH